ncbi:MCE family protein, partial [bacterium]|nr:MCE family protein [bacterium]
MRNFSTEAKVGAFFVVVFGLIAWISTKLGDYGFEEARAMTLSATFNTAAGVSEGTKVNLAGIKIGVVKDIELDGPRARIIFTIRSSVKIPEDSQVSIQTFGFLGQRYLEIMPGSSNRTMDDGEHFYNVEDAQDISQLTANLGHISEDIKAVTGNLRAVMGTPDAQQSMQEIFEAFNAITTSLASTLEANERNMDQIMGNLNKFTT